jgi:hypothetical protein
MGTPKTRPYGYLSLRVSSDNFVEGDVLVSEAGIRVLLAFDMDCL